MLYQDFSDSLKRTVSDLLFLTFVFTFLLMLPLVAGCASTTGKDELFKAFTNPPSRAKPFVRWWWNGNLVNAGEIRREIGIMESAGIGGFEINPIAHPGGPHSKDKPGLKWLSPEWNRLVKLAAQEARKRGMIPDIIVGSGWPFGAEFLKKDQMTQRLSFKSIPVKGAGKHTWKVHDLLEKMRFKTGRAWKNAPAPDLLFVILSPERPQKITDCRDMTGQITGQGLLTLTIPAGHQYKLNIVARQRGFSSVVLGAPGAMGPVLNHYDSTAVRSFLDKMSNALNPTFNGRFGGLIRAVFCDSIELSGANWTNDFEQEFRKRRGYELRPWLPFVADFHSPPDVGEQLADQALRARYDFSKTLVELFYERFILTYHNWCHENGALSRFQAYGSPWLLGMLDAYLVPDIPETNNWLFSPDAYAHGYPVWTKYASSAAHLAGRRIISTEAMTNTRGVFRTTLEMIKAADDMNFLMGVSSSVLHGFNYSPPEAGFPGWVRYGTYFNEKNSWWKFFPLWSSYNGRLSSVWQDTKPVAQVAVLAPRSDTWSRYGLQRSQFQTEPWYAQRIWEPISRCGATAEFISETVLRGAEFKDGKLCFGPAEYEALVLAGVESLEPKTAEALFRFAKAGGKIAFIDKIPSRSPGLKNFALNDQKVKAYISDCMKGRKRTVFKFKSPGKEYQRDQFTVWADRLLERLDIKRSVRFERPDTSVYQVHRRNNDHDVFFLVNTQKERKTISASFNSCGGQPWIWDPQRGKRSPFPKAGIDGTRLEIVLDPLESVLIVFQKGKVIKDVEPSKKAAYCITPPPGGGQKIEGPWKVHLIPFKGKSFDRDAFDLIDLGKSKDKKLSSFSGCVVYKKTIYRKDKSNNNTWLDLGLVHGISQLRINGKKIGTRWYGRHIYPTGDALHNGNNEIQVSVTTTLYNYAASLKNNPVAARWVRSSRRKGPAPSGMIGPVKLIP